MKIMVISIQDNDDRPFFHIFSLRVFPTFLPDNPACWGWVTWSNLEFKMVDKWLGVVWFISDYQGSVSQGIPMMTKFLAATKNYFGCRCMLLYIYIHRQYIIYTLIIFLITLIIIYIHRMTSFIHIWCLHVHYTSDPYSPPSPAFSRNSSEMP